MNAPLVRHKTTQTQYLLTRTVSSASPDRVQCRCESARELPGAAWDFDSTEVRWFDAGELELLDGSPVPPGYENA